MPAPLGTVPKRLARTTRRVALAALLAAACAASAPAAHRVRTTDRPAAVPVFAPFEPLLDVVAAALARDAAVADPP